MSDPEMDAKLDLYKTARLLTGGLSAAFLAAALFTGNVVMNQNEKITEIKNSPAAAETYREVFRETCEDQIVALSETREMDAGAQDQCMNYHATKSFQNEIMAKDILKIVSLFTLAIGGFAGTASFYANRAVRREEKNNQSKPGM